MKRYKNFLFRAVFTDVNARIPWDILYPGNLPGLGAVFIKDGKAHQGCVTIRIRILKIIDENRLADNFLGIFKIMNARNLHESLGRASLGDGFNKKWNRQSIEIDVYRFLDVKILRVKRTETQNELSVRPIGL